MSQDIYIIDKYQKMFFWDLFAILREGSGEVAMLQKCDKRGCHHLPLVVENCCSGGFAYRSRCQLVVPLLRGPFSSCTRPTAL